MDYRVICRTSDGLMGEFRSQSLLRAVRQFFIWRVLRGRYTRIERA